MTIYLRTRMHERWPRGLMLAAICAWIVLASGEQADEEEIKSFCRGQIAHFKIPRYVRFVSELPMPVTGKPQKFKMRAAMQKLVETGKA